ncbi:repressor LexA [Sphingomonas xinjiangensis]|uniref:LexA repressor n=2 Tax=Sphingomonas xinjiangensis TaxID=643568 RepID=A0A840YNE8_9SPHN|nr:repressor LexA [Sphingomonas xinjiangensis]
MSVLDPEDFPMLTRKQHELICFIADRLNETGVSPSFEEMKEALDLKSKSGVHRLISALEEREFIRRLPNRARALEVLRMPERKAEGPQRKAKAPSAAAPSPTSVTPANDVVEIPLHGRIAAGTPIEALEGATMLPVPAALLGAGEHYALEVAGDSMVEAGILDGDYALIRRTETARDGEIVVALIEDAEATLKYFRKEGAMVRLDPANRSYDAQRYRPDQVRVQGRLAGLLRRY